MSEATRRSGRATKGVTTKNQEAEAAEQKPKKGKAKPAKKGSQQAEQTEDDDEEENAIIRCICGQYEEDDEPRTMVCCDKCSAWQHNDCMGITEDEDELPEHYFCEQCKPQDHKPLLAAIARGERPWEAAQQKREEIERQRKQKKGKKGKGGRQSKAQELSREPVDGEVSQVASPTVSEGNKRKLEDNSVEQEQPSKRKSVVQSGDDSVPPPRKITKGRKSSAPQPEVMANSIDELPKERQGAANALRKKLDEQIQVLSRENTFRIPDRHTSSSLAEELAIAIEHAMFLNYAAETKNFSGPYKGQFIAIQSNIVKNVSLLHRLLDGTLSADELAKMSTDDMASEELQEQIQKMKAETDKQSILVQEEATGPRVRRTHKGDEFVEDQNSLATEHTTTNMPAPSRIDSSAIAQSPTIPQGASHGSPMQIDTAPSAESTARRSSSNFNLGNVWSSVQSPAGASARALKDSHKRASIGAHRTPSNAVHKQEHDEDIDRLLKDEADDDVLSPEEEAAVGSTVWHGIVDMPSAGGTIAKFYASAHHVAGNDLYLRPVSLPNIFPPSLTLLGRIAADKADEYLLSLAMAHNTDVTICRIVPDADSPTAASEFDKLHHYFLSRQRWGVVGEADRPENISDCYLIPLEAGAGPMPTSVDNLAYSIIEQPRPTAMFLLAIVTKWKPPVIDTSSGADRHYVAQPDVSTMSPYTPNPALQQYPNMPPPAHPPASLSPTMAGAPGQQQQMQGQMPHDGMPPPLQGHQIQHYPPPPHGSLPFGNPYAQQAPPPQHQAQHQHALNPHTFPHAPPAQHSQAPHQSLPQQPQPPQPFTPQSRPATIATAQAILGPFFGCPVAQQIMESQPVPENSLNNMREIFEVNPRSREDMVSFVETLNLKK